MRGGRKEGGEATHSQLGLDVQGGEERPTLPPQISRRDYIHPQLNVLTKHVKYKCDNEKQPIPGIDVFEKKKYRRERHTPPQRITTGVNKEADKDNNKDSTTSNNRMNSTSSKDSKGKTDNKGTETTTRAPRAARAARRQQDHQAPARATNIKKLTWQQK